MPVPNQKCLCPQLSLPGWPQPRAAFHLCSPHVVANFQTHGTQPAHSLSSLDCTGTSTRFLSTLLLLRFLDEELLPLPFFCSSVSVSNCSCRFRSVVHSSLVFAASASRASPSFAHDKQLPVKVRQYGRSRLSLVQTGHASTELVV